MKLKAMGKINLALDVVRKREDGYHEVRMIMQTVDLWDELEFHETKEPGIRLATNLSYLPVNENNLVFRAASLLMNEFQIHSGLEIRLHKRIPVAAGMAGGSSDAAAALVGVNRMFRLGLTRKELMSRAVGLGADVPYCVLRGTALAEGIGEILTPLPPLPRCHILIGKPPVSVSTKFVYGHLKLSEIRRHPEVDKMAEALAAGSLEGITSRMENVLESVTVPAYPVIREIKEHMIRNGAENALMSGSGPTVFGIFKDRGTAGEAFRELKKSGLVRQIYLTRPFGNGGYRHGKR